MYDTDQYQSRYEPFPQSREVAELRRNAVFLARANPVDFLRERLDLLRYTDPLEVDSSVPFYAIAGELTPAFVADATAMAFRRILEGTLAHRWSDVRGLAPRSARQTELLRGTLTVVLDEDRPLPERLAQLWPGTVKADTYNPGALTPLLHIKAPAQRAVWSREVESALTTLGLFPEPALVSMADQYASINQAQLHLAQDLRITLWQLENLLRSVHHMWQTR